MIRAPMGDADYWNKWEKFSRDRIAKRQAVLGAPSANPGYMPQYAFDLSLDIGKYILTLYSRGDAVAAMAVNFQALLDAWELSNKLSTQVCAERGVVSCRDWDFSLKNLNHYVWCFWLIGLALVLEVPEKQWNSLLGLIGGEGEDVLLDKVVASRQEGRKIGGELLHEKPYRRLLSAIDAPTEKQAELLEEFVDHWYAELKRPAPKIRREPTIEPFWYTYGDPKLMPLEGGTYFGRWCIEAVAAVKAFGIDDSKCVGHEQYPRDLLPARAGAQATEETLTVRPGLLSRLFGSRK